VGPLINRGAVDRLHDLVADAISRGAKVLLGAKFEDNCYHPTILYHVPTDAKIMGEETFGPVIPITSVKDADEAIDLVIRSRYGLDSCVFTFNIKVRL
jgi:acyl-CoA reductase-like NAD-dependent aldehyde dehydrogenase